jgi:hypothetical protein
MAKGNKPQKNDKVKMKPKKVKTKPTKVFSLHHDSAVGDM